MWNFQEISFFSYFSQNYYAQLILLIQLKTISRFKIAKFEFMVTVHYGLDEKTPSCDYLMLAYFQTLK